MFNMIQITLKAKIQQDNQKHDSIVTIESIRDFILSLCDNEPEMIKNIINNKLRALPKIMYSRPYNNEIRIFSLGEEGRVGLNSIYVNLVTAGYVKVKNIKYSIKGLPKLITDVSTLPICDGATYTYTTLTPIMIFNRVNHKVFQAIAGKHFEEGKYFDKSTEAKQKAFYLELEIFVNNQIRDSIKYILSSIMPTKKKEDFEFVDSIVIDWVDINVVFQKYHSEERAMPMIVGKFTSNFTLPKFIGYKIGKGFGEVSLKNRVNGGIL